MDRRALFFLVGALVAAALYPLAPADLRWVAGAVSVTYLVLSAMSALDAWSRKRD